jgi:uncharacterized membrane protein
MKKVKTVFKLLVTSAVFSMIFTIAVYATTKYEVGSLAITSTYSRTTDPYDYTDANAYATYSVNSISTGSAGYTRFYTTLQRSTAGYWQGLGTRTTKLTKANLSTRVTWSDIVSGTFKYQITGETGTTYASLIVGSY